MASSTPASLAKLIDFVIRWRSALLAASVLAALLAIGPASQLRFDRSVESMFRADDPVLVGYQELSELFGGTEAFAVSYTDPDLLTPEGLRRLGRLSDRLLSVPGVVFVQCLENVPAPSAPLDRRPLSQQVEAKSLSPAALKGDLLGSKLLRGTLLGEDGETTVIVGELEPPHAATAPRKETLETVRRIADEHEPRAFVAGEPILVHDVFSYMEADGTRLGIASTVLLTLVILVLFRNLRWVLLPLAVVHFALVATKAFLVVSGMQLSMVSSPLVALVTVIGVATVVHITMRFREARQSRSPRDALHRTGMTVGPAVFWTCLTTAAGFASLLISQITPVRSFGLMMAVGSLFVFVAAMGILPGGILLGRRRTADVDQEVSATPTENDWVGSYLLNDPRSAPGEAELSEGLETIVRGVERHPWRVALVTAALLGFATVGFFRVEVATDFTENYRENSPIVESYRFLSERMGVIASLDVLIDAPAQLTAEFLDRLRLLQTELDRVPGVVVSLSLVDTLDVIERIGVSDLLDLLESTRPPGDGLMDRLTRGPLEWLPVPQRLRVQVPLEMRLEAMEQLQPDMLARFWNRERNVMRIAIQAGARNGAGEKKELIERIKAAAREHFPTKLFTSAATEGSSATDAVLHHALDAGQVPDGMQRDFKRADVVWVDSPTVVVEEPGSRWSIYDPANHRSFEARTDDGQISVYSPPRVAGAFVLLTYLVESLLADQWTTFALASCGIFLMMCVAFQSWQLGLVALIPNLAPILMVMGAMGWIGLKLNMATAMIASVSMGLAVDFSIHYLYRFHRERAAGATFYEALRVAHGSVGLAMVLANIALIAGFSVLVISSFIPTVHFGILVGVAMLGGLMGNLVILPLLLSILPSMRKEAKPVPRRVRHADRRQKVP